MKKILIIQVILLILVSNLLSQVKVNFSLSNPVKNGEIFSYDVIATVPAGQQWNTGMSNIRVAFNTIPPNAVSVVQDNPAVNANLNISNSANYGPMSTTGIITDTISLNILQLYQHGYYTFAPGTYTLGSIRFNILDSTACINTIILPFSVIFDQSTPLSYSTQWTKTDTSCTPIGIDVHRIGHVPVNYKLFQNYPNPFNPSTKIRFEIPKQENVKIEIFDELGRSLGTIVNFNFRAGSYEFTWDGTNYASGLYFYRIIAGDFIQTNKMVLMK